MASRVLHEKALGRDRVADHKAAKNRKRTAQETAEAKSFGVLVRRYAEEHGKPHQRRWRYTLKQLGLDYPHDGLVIRSRPRADWLSDGLTSP